MIAFLVQDFLQLWDEGIYKEKFWLIFYDIKTTVKMELIGIDKASSLSHVYHSQLDMTQFPNCAGFSSFVSHMLISPD